MHVTRCMFIKKNFKTQTHYIRNIFHTKTYKFKIEIELSPFDKVT